MPSFRAPIKEVRLALDMMLLCTLTWAGLTFYTHAYRTVIPLPLHTAATTAAVAVPHVAPTQVQVQSAHLEPPAIQVSAQRPPASVCTPDHSYAPAGPVELDASLPGVHAVVDSPHYYHVYGNTSAEIRQQIIQCAPTTHTGSDAAYSGQTDFWIGWQFSYGTIPTGCHVTSVAVGLHITQAYPTWQPTATAQQGLAAEWQAFISGLTTHEQGHVALGKQYAQALWHDVQFMSASDCSSLVQAVNNQARQDVAALNTANEAYDAHTNHGMTQGAVLP